MGDQSMPSATDLDKLPEASLSFAVSVIPSQPLRQQIVLASKTIAEQFSSTNVVDDQAFPPHLSLLLAGTQQVLIDDVRRALDIALPPHLSATLVAEVVYSDSGFVSIGCREDGALLGLAWAVIHAFAGVHSQHPHYRARTLARWNTLAPSRRQAVKVYGTERIPPDWQPHLSVGDVQAVHAAKAIRIAKRLVDVPQEFRIEAIEFVDIGSENERWEVLHRWRPG
jgi:hypothetical protein